MRRLRIQFTLARIMSVIAILAVVMAVMSARFPVEYKILSLVFATIVSLISICTSSSWISTAAWISCFYPVLPLLSLYATWLTAWFEIGHPPRPYLDDPKFVGSLVKIPYHLTYVFLEGYFPALIICIVLVLTNALPSLARGRGWTAKDESLFVVALLSWLSTFLIVRWDPGNVLYWYMD